MMQRHTTTRTQAITGIARTTGFSILIQASMIALGKHIKIRHLCYAKSLAIGF